MSNAPEGGKADDAEGTVGGLAIDHWSEPATLRGRTFEGSVQATGDGIVLAQRLVIPVADSRRTLAVSVETLDRGVFLGDDEITQFTLERRADADEPWTSVTDGDIVGFSKVEVDREAGELQYEAIDVDGRDLDGSIRLEGTADEYSVRVVPHVALIASDTKTRLAYRVEAVCDGTEVCREAPVLSLSPRIDLSSETLFNKSGAYHRAREAMYLTSLGDGTITRVVQDEYGPKESLFFAGEPNMSTIGVAIDQDNDRLWTCAVDNSKESLPGQIWVFDLDDGSAPAEVYDLSEAFPDGNCNEVVLAGPDTLFTSDRQNPNVYKIDRRSNSVEVFATDEDLLTGELVGPNGIAVTEDGDHLLVVNYNHPRLMVIPTEGEHTVTRVDLDRSGATLFTSNFGLGGPAGMLMFEGALHIVFPSRLARVSPRDPQWKEAWLEMGSLDRGPTEGQWLTGPILVDDELFVTNGQTATYLRDKEPVPFFVQHVDWSVFD